MLVLLWSFGLGTVGSCWSRHGLLYMVLTGCICWFRFGLLDLVLVADVGSPWSVGVGTGCRFWFCCDPWDLVLVPGVGVAVVYLYGLQILVSPWSVGGTSCRCWYLDGVLLLTWLHTSVSRGFISTLDRQLVPLWPDSQ